MISARVIAITMPIAEEIPHYEDLLAYCGRVSNADNQLNHETADRLMLFCAKHEHWSFFEMVNLNIEVVCPRDISRQILRHRSMHFQEFSQRYSLLPEFITDRELRMQHPTNRQASVPTLDPMLHADWQEDQRKLAEYVGQLADKWIKLGAAKECVRVLYPEGLAPSKMYINATIRDWWHYCRVRSGHGTQPEHVDLANRIAAAIHRECPRTWSALKGMS